MGSMSRKTKRLMKHTPWMSQKGASAVELAIVFPLLILLIFGMIEFGLYLFNRHVITNAAREGARFGIVARSVRWSNDDIKNVVMNYSQQNLVTFGTDTLDINDVTIKPIDDDFSDGFDPATNRCVVFEYELGGNKFRCDLEVKIDYTYNFLFLKTIGIDTLDIQSVATMKME